MTLWVLFVVEVIAAQPPGGTGEAAVTPFAIEAFAPFFVVIGVAGALRLLAISSRVFENPRFVFFRHVRQNFLPFYRCLPICGFVAGGRRLHQ